MDRELYKVESLKDSYGNKDVRYIVAKDIVQISEWMKGRNTKFETITKLTQENKVYLNIIDEEV